MICLYEYVIIPFLNHLFSAQLYISCVVNFFSFQDVSGSGGDWRFELRVRYLPLDLAEIYDKDPLTFSSYYDQVVNDYLHKSFDSLDQELAIQLG